MTAIEPAADPSFAVEVEARVLAAEVAAAVAAGAFGPGAARRPVDHAALWRHATRRPGTPADFAAARLLRDDPAARGAANRMIAARALATSPMAYAAADSTATARRIGPFSLDVDPPGGAVAAVVIAVPEGGPVPTVLRAEGGGHSLVLALPPADEGAIELWFTPGDPDHDAALAALREPTVLIALE